MLSWIALFTNRGNRRTTQSRVLYKRGIPFLLKDFVTAKINKNGAVWGWEIIYSVLGFQ